MLLSTNKQNPGVATFEFATRGTRGGMSFRSLRVVQKFTRMQSSRLELGVPKLSICHHVFLAPSDVIANAQRWFLT